MSLAATEFEYNGYAFAFDIRDADDADRYENALAVLQDAEKNMKRDGKATDLIRYQCDMIKQFFNVALNEDGAGEKVCTERDNFMVCVKAYEAFLDYLKMQKDEMHEVTNDFMQSVGNREQRRAAAKKTSAKKTSTK